MTDRENINEYTLREEAQSIADEIWSKVEGDIDDAMDQAHEWADSHEWVIYYHKAHQICQNCDTENGEQFLEEIGPGDEPTYNKLAVTIAYGELRARIEQALYKLEEEAE